jgi:hypothetical protein
MTQYPPIKQTIARPSASPPPPPPLAPPLPVNTGVPKLATISEIDNLPPLPPMPPNVPPAPSLSNSTIQLLFMRSSTTSTPPTIKTNSDSNNGSSSQRDDISLTSLHQKRQSKINEHRLCVIFILIYWKKIEKGKLHHSFLFLFLIPFFVGIQLNNRKKEEKKATVTTKTSSLNAISTTEQAAKYPRNKIRPQSEFDNENESSRWDDSD